MNAEQLNAMRTPLLIGFIIVSIPASLALSSARAASQEFYAELVGVDPHGNPTKGALNVSDGKVRIETPEVKTGFFLFMGDTAYFVRPGQRVFMDAKQSSLIAQIFIPVDAETPCDRWQARAKLSGAADDGGEWRCERVGDEAVDERSTVLFKAVSPQHRSYSVWIDKKLNFPVRLQAQDGSRYRLEHIDEQPQSQDLFVVPDGYAKFDPQKLIERLKQSDVWVVEPPR
jgi:hypothetical protein